MRHVHYVRGVLVLLLLYSGLSFGQLGPHDLLVPAPTGPGQYLNDVVLGDTLANGTRKDAQRVYVLQRGGFYLVDAVITNTGWPFQMKAQDSTGTLPTIFLYPNRVTNNIPGQFVSIRGNLWLKKLIMIGYFEPIDSLVGKLQGALFNMAAPGFDVVIDSCILSNTNGNHVRTDQAPRLVKITNNIFANMGYLGTSNLGAGKAIDVRAGSVDSLIMVNNTFVNSQDRIIRHFSSTAAIKFLKFDHNTIVNGMGFHGSLSLGKVGPRVIITNNLWYDGFALGNDADSTRQLEFTDSGEKDQFGRARMTWVITSPNDTTNYTINNNYFTITSAGQSFFTANGLTEGSPLTWYINRRLGADSVKAFTKESLTLTKVPQLMAAMMNWYRSPTGGNKTKSTTGWNRTFDFDRKGYVYLRDTLKCTYGTTALAYTGATGGFPVGDLNWYPTRKSEWEKSPVSSVGRFESAPASFSLDQNYPNPFNPSTRIVYALAKESKIRLEVFDLLGRKVAMLVDGVKNAGEHSLDFDASRLSTGVYVYRLSSPDLTVSKKMMLMK